MHYNPTSYATFTPARQFYLPTSKTIARKSFFQILRRKSSNLCCIILNPKKRIFQREKQSPAFCRMCCKRGAQDFEQNYCSPEPAIFQPLPSFFQSAFLASLRAPFATSPLPPPERHQQPPQLARMLVLAQQVD